MVIVVVDVVVAAVAVFIVIMVSIVSVAWFEECGILYAGIYKKSSLLFLAMSYMLHNEIGE